MSSINYIVGLAGAILIVIAWIPETIHTIRAKKSGLEIHFAVIYVIAAILLTIYSILILDFVFIFLNSIAAILGAINSYYTLKYG